MFPLSTARAVPAFAQPTLTWNLVHDLQQLVQYRFMVHAFEAGTVVALVAAPIGWFMVLRGQTFAGHTLAVVGFPGAAGAVLIGVSASIGSFVFCLTAAVVIAAVPRLRGGSASEETAVIGTVQAFALACGFLFASLYAGNLSTANGLLFGTFLGITSVQVVWLVAGGAVALVGLAVIGRPLLFASVDPEVAAGRGVPVSALSVVFLVLLGLAAAEATQITGSLLVFALLVLPAATAQVVCARPALGLVLSIGIALGVIWLSLAVAYFSPYPIGFWVTTIAFGAYVAVRLAAWLGPRRHAQAGAV
jgi:zinc/manganese transport system permease protein